MVRKETALVLAVAMGAALIAGSQQQDSLYREFQDPPADARPFVRWWWNGNHVTGPEILRQLDVMKAAGIGGVEINSVAMPPEAPAESRKLFRALDWLSPEWNQMVKIATGGARERGMKADLIVGSGWPFGGRFLPAEMQTQRVLLVKRDLAGPQRLEISLAELRKTPAGRRGEAVEPSIPPRLVFLRLAPAGLTEFQPGRDLTAAVTPGGSISLDVPEGKHVLYAGFHEAGFTNVKLGAPGSDGPVVDHFNAQAVGFYLRHMSNGLSPALGGRMGNALRAAFVDSLELDRANWTADLPGEFLKRRGYELTPYLPFALDADPGGDSAFADTVRRVRYDYHRTLVELFHERFLRTYIEWCKANGVQGRIQAYGRETHVLEGSMQVDLPEGESWLWGDADKVIPGPTPANKYVSSGAHLAGKPLISFEAMTNTVPVFRETLEDFKAGLDLSLMTGVIHPVMHGFNYTPPEAGFPGWIRFGSYLNEKNTWWPHFRNWADYSARLTAVLRSTTATGQVAILGPRADEWARAGLLYQPFPETHLPWYHYFLWEALQHNGVSSDYTSENVLQASSFANGRLRYGSREYEALILMDVESLEPETAAAVEKYARAGGKIIFVGRAPGRSPGLRESAARDALVRGRIEAALRAAGNRAAVIPAPVQQETATRAGRINQMGMPQADRENLMRWSADMMRRFSITPEVRFSAASPWVSFIHHRQGQRDFFFLVNTNREQAAQLEAAFPTGDKTPWQWDPHSGRRWLYGGARNGARLAIRLEPCESILLVFEPAGGARGGETAPAVVRAAASGGIAVTSPWQASFQPVNGVKPFERKFETLLDLSKAADASLATFAGTIVYRTEFEVSDPRHSVLDLGQVYNISEVTLNGKSLGVRWYGRHVYDARGAAVKGTNRLEVKVTTMLGNYVKSLAPGNPVAKRWAAWFPPIPAGLAGPVRLAEPAN